MTSNQETAAAILAILERRGAEHRDDATRCFRGGHDQAGYLPLVLANEYSRLLREIVEVMRLPGEPIGEIEYETIR